MSFNEHFIPGKWIDTIDVNDFVNLNKKPFLSQPVFLEKNIKTDINSYLSSIKNAFNENEIKIHLGFSNFDDRFVHRFDSLNLTVNPFVVPVGYSEELEVFRDGYDIESIDENSSFSSNKFSSANKFLNYNHIATSDMKKMINIALLKQMPTNFSVSTFHPDIRIISLYGTKFLIKEKKWILKSSEKRLKTNDWIQQRIDIQNEISFIENLERFATSHNVDITKPSGNSKEVLDSLLISITYLFLENPSIPFCFDQILPFLDIFIENDLEDGLLTEEDAQAIIDSFYLQCSLFRFSVNPNQFDCKEKTALFFSETITVFNISKTTYRFLNSLTRLEFFDYHINLSFDNSEYEDFDKTEFLIFFNSIKEKLHTYSFYNPQIFKKNISLSFDYNGQAYVPSEDLVFDMGVLDLKKLLFLAFNGGKDVVTNSNITPISQPIRKDIFQYDEFFSKFKDFLTYSINNFFESAIIISTLSSRLNTQPVRNSMSYYIKFFNPQFSFENIQFVASVFSAIKEDNLSITRNKKGWITELSTDSEIDNEVFFDLVQLIETEIKKIPQHKMGEISIRFLNSLNNLDFSELRTIETIIPELSTSKFMFDVVGTPSIDELIEFSSEGYSCIHVTNPNSTYLNNSGTIFKEKYKK